MERKPVNRKRTVYRILEKMSFRGILILSFIFVSIVPILTLQYFSYYRLSENLQDNMNRLSISNVTQTKNNLSITLDAYDDLLYQIYTSDEIVTLVNKIDALNDHAVHINQLRRTLRGMCYAKDNIEAISIVTAGGQAIYYDKLTASSVNSSWIGKGGMTREAILEKGMGDYSTKILPTGFAMNVGSTPVYTFHMFHRLLDYKSIDNELGVVILSLNENVLQTICNRDMPEGTFSFIVDESGRIISFPQKKYIGLSQHQGYNHYDRALAKNAYRALLKDSSYLFDTGEIYYSDMKNGLRVVSVVDQGSFYDEISAQQKNMLLIGIIIISATVLLILTITTLLSRSIGKVTAAMKQAQRGDLEVSVSEDNVFSSEMMTIVRTFNEMMRRIGSLIEEIKLATIRQKDAEIKALEAQINPHFLYNILDSINWIAIDKDQFEVSQMITALAKNLRYSINNSNAIVPLRNEIDWLRQYIYLQQMRYKNSFEYAIEVDGQILDYPVHKLMLQPFVENSIIHGFKESERKNLLNILCKDELDTIRINIRDNGCGISKEILESVIETHNDLSDHIGMANAIGRIRMYYGEDAQVIVDSEQGIGTNVIIRLAKSDEGMNA